MAEAARTTGGHLALTIAAGSVVAAADGAAGAIRDRHGELKRVLARRIPNITSPADGATLDEAQLAALAGELEAGGAASDKDVITVARELLGLIRLDDAARTAVGERLADVEAALTALSRVDVESAPVEAKPVAARTEPKAEPPKPAAERKLPADRESRKVPLEAHSKTELERQALPIWKRTDRFFLKAGILVATYVLLGLVAWLLLRTPPSESLERCRGGEKARCWQVVASEDALDEDHRVSTEPLQLLCEKHGDACACAGLAYINAADPDREPECLELAQASSLDPTWPCKCTRYGFWRPGQLRASHCTIPRCP